MERDDKKIEELVDKLMSADRLEQPSIDFTTNVMSKVEAISNSKATVYKPLIPKYVWYMLFCSLGALVAYVYLKDPVVNSEWLKKIEFSKLAFNPFENLSVNSSKTMMYSLVLLAIMVGVQVPLLKNYFNKKVLF